MAETTVIAAQVTGPPGWLGRFAEGAWPVWPSDLERTIREQAEEREMRVLSVGEAMRRGPIPIHGVDEDGRMRDEVVAHVAQLYAYVEWEPLTNASGSAAGPSACTKDA